MSRGKLRKSEHHLCSFIPHTERISRTHRQDFTSGCSLAFLRAIIPSALVALALLSLIPVPRLVKKLAFPVIDTIEDRTSINAISSTRVKETLEANKHVGPPRWKQAVLIGGGLVASLWWMVILGLNIVHVTSAGAGRKQIVWRAWTTGMIIFSWVSPYLPT
jgi:hypothetical protein